ncbi:aminodeoxychorismate/anthranilate synthase component II [candidate division NPL-UPA2 bacterium Unc8]|uniref:Aminodeoxychorismate/anthranilate synthase component II n=1 Tax=candidate division NPL-UPA2 bacterium Unc8 TaxID=1980939 RepID=A0A399FU37_UNCN2|nr:Aminodeoxychorismate/anthranilate synthase component 2 [Bacillota bacterium]MBT9148044.1 Aminodeoxychorismate/anthranilate synthase component 2 [Bacillota bacterium]RIH99460.1 MAG: aminodeoxychorismate/anthranilate synthase component II [candidate division NPL-UPA2 bacterium Unc8]
MILIIDNYDSFTYNLVQAFGALGEEMEIYRNDRIEVAKMKSLQPSHLVISPGPGIPEKAGVSIESIRLFAGKIPILGVCLGHQAIYFAFGGEIISADRLMHGKTSFIHHDGKKIYRGLTNPFEATRYHSLIVKESTLPDCLRITARSEKGEIMGIRHREFQIEGVQFHPESILTTEGVKLLKNFIGYHE